MKIPAIIVFLMLVLTSSIGVASAKPFQQNSTSIHYDESGLWLMLYYGRKLQARGVPVDVKGKPLTFDNIAHAVTAPNSSPFTGYVPGIGVSLAAIPGLMKNVLKWPVEFYEGGKVAELDERFADGFLNQGYDVIYRFCDRWLPRTIRIDDGKAEAHWSDEVYFVRFVKLIRQVKVSSQKGKAPSYTIVPLTRFNYDVVLGAFLGELPRVGTFRATEIPVRTTTGEGIGNYVGTVRSALLIRFDDRAAVRYIAAKEHLSELEARKQYEEGKKSSSQPIEGDLQHEQADTSDNNTINP